MNKLSIFVACAIIALLTGCGSGVKPMSADQILVPEAFYNEQAMNLAATYRQEIEAVIAAIRSRYHFTELEFNGPTKEGFPNGLTFCYREGQAESNEIFLCLSVFTTTRVDSHETTYSMRATHVFRRYGRELMEILYASGIPDDEQIAGVSLTLWWHTTDFQEQTDTSRGEGFNIFAPTETLKQYFNNEISGQEFLRQCRTMGGTGRETLGAVKLDELEQ